MLMWHAPLCNVHFAIAIIQTCLISCRGGRQQRDIYFMLPDHNRDYIDCIWKTLELTAFLCAHFESDKEANYNDIGERKSGG